jgi:hypothetical protein
MLLLLPRAVRESEMQRQFYTMLAHIENY